MSVITIKYPFPIQRSRKFARSHFFSFMQLIPPFFLVVSVSVMTVSPPASEITTLSSQSSPNVPLSLSTKGDIIDVTTIRDDSLKVLPLDLVEATTTMVADNKTNLLDDKEKSDDDDESIVTSSPKTTQLPMIVNLFETKTRPENDGSDNQTTLPTTFDDIDEEKNQSVEMMMLQEKEGRAINFPLEILNSDQHSRYIITISKLFKGRFINKF